MNIGTIIGAVKLAHQRPQLIRPFSSHLLASHGTIPICSRCCYMIHR